ncbi:hypothetical protein [Hydrogenophaga sp.]|uniref:hypothetical protein n=1 Tax=Hydrogenophaga sp. TaxID=1904254 RepID=UPI0035B46296
MSADVLNDLSIKLEHCKTVCMKLGLPLVQARIHGVLDACHLDLDETSFFALLPQERPSAVFYETTLYDPEEFIRGAMVAQGWKQSWEKSRESLWPTTEEIKSRLNFDFARIENQIGLPRSLMLTYAIHGQHRICWHFADWVEDLSGKVEKILESRFEEEENALSQIAVSLDSLIAEVAKDPEFRAIRGRPKRLLFLQKKYGARIPPHPRGQIARPAQNCDLVDQNIAIVLVKSDELAWAAENLD